MSTFGNRIKLEHIPTLKDCEDMGFKPTEYNVIIAVAKVPEKTSGGIIIPVNSAETQELSHQIGRMVAKSPLTFNYTRWPDGVLPPQIDDIVFFSKYAGTIMTGMDGIEYRIMKDKDVAGTYEIKE